MSVGSVCVFGEPWLGCDFFVNRRIEISNLARELLPFHCTEKVDMGHGKGHFGPFSLPAPSNTLFFHHFPPFKDPYKKSHFSTQSPSFGASQPYLWPHPTPFQRRLPQNPFCRHPFAPLMGLFASPFKDPYENFYFLTPRTFPLQRPLQNPLFFQSSLRQGISILSTGLMIIALLLESHFPTWQGSATLQVALKQQYYTVL